MRRALNATFAVHLSNVVVFDARSVPRTVSPSNVPFIVADDAGLNGLRWPLWLSEWANDPFALIARGQEDVEGRPGGAVTSGHEMAEVLVLADARSDAADVHDFAAVRR